MKFHTLWLFIWVLYLFSGWFIFLPTAGISMNTCKPTEKLFYETLFIKLLLSSADCFKINFFKKFYQKCYKSVNQLGSRSDLDLGPDCLRILSEDNKIATSKQRVLSVLNWVQTVSKNIQQTIKVAACQERA